MGEHDDLIPDFVIECLDSIEAFDDELIALEKDPANIELLNSIFRRLHSIKGICGFLHFSTLEALSHAGEDLMCDLRDGRLTLNSTITDMLLRVGDAIKAIIAQVQATKTEGTETYDALVRELRDTRLKLLNITDAAHAPSSNVSSQPHVAPLDTTLRVDVHVLDRLMNLAGELVLARNQILQTTKAIEDPSFRAIVHRLDAVTSELQEGVMKTRLQPLSSLWDKLPRLVRDISHSTGKAIFFRATGGHTELDKTILEAIKDPLTHLIRNAIDHGIEPAEIRRRIGKPDEGQIHLRAFPDGGYVIIELQDDGSGLNTQKISQQAIARGLLTPKQATGMSDSQIHRFIFAPGFSTADKVTSISGRGVGMDVVRTNIESISGQIQISSESGRGTTMRLKIPLSLSIIPTLLVSCSKELFAIPETAVTELVKISQEQHATSVVHAGNSAFLRLRDEMLPLVSLAQYLGLDDETTPSDDYIVVVLSVEGCRFGVVVDTVHDIEEIVVKSLDMRLQALLLYAGATILGDGTIVLIVDPSGMLHHLQLQRPDSIDTYTTSEVSVSSEANPQENSYLIVATDTCPSTALPIQHVKRIERLKASLLENIGQCHVIQYRGTVLPIINRARLDYMSTPPDQLLSIVVLCSDDGRELGLIVDSVVDISKRKPTATTLHSQETMHVSIVDNNATLLLDIPTLFEQAYGHTSTSVVDRYSEGRL